MDKETSPAKGPRSPAEGPSTRTPTTIPQTAQAAPRGPTRAVPRRGGTVLARIEIGYARDFLRAALEDMGAGTLPGVEKAVRSCLVTLGMCGIALNEVIAGGGR